MSESREERVQREYQGWSADDLEREIERADKLYWDSKPTGLSDALFEALLSRLREVKADSLTLKKVGERPSPSSDKVEHTIPMLSLRKVTDDRGIHEWIQKTRSPTFYVSPKVDGVACSLVYDDSGVLEYAATRGDGVVGEIITDAVVECGAVPSEIDRGPLEIRGELFVSKSDFARMSGASCARNVASGYVKRNEPDEAFPLQFFPYDVPSCESEGRKQRIFDEIGFESPGIRVIKRTAALGSVLASIEDERPSWPFDADGIVLRVDSHAEFHRLGFTSHHPRGALAYKFPDELAETGVTGIGWDVSRTGTITPVAELEPVHLAGAEISRATLHHVGRYKSLGVRKGSKVVVARRGGVIPHVHAVLRSTVKPQPPPPKECPSCGEPTEVFDGQSTGAATLKCTRVDDCPRALRGQIIHFASALDIKGLGPSMVDRLLDEGLIERPSDLFTLHESLTVKGKTERNLLREISGKRIVNFPTFLAALGMDHVGAATAKLIAARWDSTTFLRLISPEDLIGVPGIGASVAHSIIRQVSDMAPEIARLGQHIEIIETRGGKGGKFPSGPLVGASILFTGSLQMGRTRATQRAVQAGAWVAKSVTKTLDFLVASDPLGDSAKLRRAKELNDKGAEVSVISEEAFQRILP